MSSSTDGPSERKVQLTGGSTYTVSLPKAWAEANGVSVGTRLSLYPHRDRSLVVRPVDDGGESLGRTRIDAYGVDEADLWDRVTAAYLAGNDAIEIRANGGIEPVHRRVARRASTQLAGLEVLEESDSHVELYDVLETEEVSLADAVEQCLTVTLSMHEEAVETVVETDVDRAALVGDIDDDVDRLFALVARNFRRSLADIEELHRLGVSREAAFAYYMCARQLERVGDHAERIAAVAERLADPPSDDLAERFVDLGGRARAVVDGTVGGVLEDDSSRIDRARSRADDLEDDLAALDRDLYELAGEEAYLLSDVHDGLARTAAHGRNVAELARRR
jgi:phosphate uptake regulator